MYSQGIVNPGGSGHAGEVSSITEKTSNPTLDLQPLVTSVSGAAWIGYGVRRLLL